MKLMSFCLGVALALLPPTAPAQRLPDDTALREQIRALDLAHADAIFKGDGQVGRPAA
jgi:hypothetical protein